MAKDVGSKTGKQGTAESKECLKGRITSLSTFHKSLNYKALKGMLEYEKPEILVEFCDEKKEICFIFEKQNVPSYIR